MNDPIVIIDYHPKLIECPFCGSARTEIHGAVPLYGICLECEASTGLYWTRDMAAEMWNMRCNNADKS